MKSTRTDLIRRILLTIDQQPASIYDIQYSMTNFSDPKRTRLPKLLKSMENENLVVSALQPGPLGPYRRIYEPGPEAERYLIENLQSAMETILHFYEEYRTSIPNSKNDEEAVSDIPTKDGKILFASYPQVNVNDLNEIRNMMSNRDITISIIGQDEILSKTGIPYDVVGSDITSIEAPSKAFSEVHLRGIPPIDKLRMGLEECKRVLSRGGVLRMEAPFVFFEKPEEASIEEFIRITAATRFPELGIVEGDYILDLIEQNFSRYGTLEIKQGKYQFWAVKS
ncbi:MAG: PadR family transcriptional regulator [Candidatus Thorarchaeota archaeon]|nr:MAG: PadR family transcriptional regulator [Candidatus Thorarchaeota archaeon]